jgi:hypothetical protein
LIEEARENAAIVRPSEIVWDHGMSKRCRTLMSFDVVLSQFGYAVCPAP